MRWPTFSFSALMEAALAEYELRNCTCELEISLNRSGRQTSESGKKEPQNEKD